MESLFELIAGIGKWILIAFAAVVLVRVSLWLFAQFAIYFAGLGLVIALCLPGVLIVGVIAVMIKYL